LIALVATFQSLIVDRFNRVTLLGYVCLAFVGIFVAIRLMFAVNVPSWITYSLIYIISDQQWLFFPLVFWVFANDSIDMVPAKRLFPVFGSIGFIGKISGIILAGVSPSILQALNSSRVELTSFIAVLYLIAYFVVRLRLRNVKIRETLRKEESIPTMLKEAWTFIGDIPLYRYLSFSIALLIACHIIIEFHFIRISALEYPDGAGFTQFYSAYRLGVALVAFAMQSFLTSRLLERMTLKNAFLAMPILVTIGFVWLIFIPGFGSAISAMVLNRLPRDTIDESAHKSLLSMVPEERRGRVALFMDNGMIGVGAVVGCVLTGLIVWLGPSVSPDYYPFGYLLLGLLLAGGGVYFVLRARMKYDVSLLSWRLKRRQRTSSVLDKLGF
jgi:MFS family permease